MKGQLQVSTPKQYLDALEEPRKVLAKLLKETEKVGFGF